MIACIDDFESERITISTISSCEYNIFKVCRIAANSALKIFVNLVSFNAF